MHTTSQREHDEDEENRLLHSTHDNESSENDFSTIDASTLPKSEGSQDYHRSSTQAPFHDSASSSSSEEHDDDVDKNNDSNNLQTGDDTSAHGSLHDSEKHDRVNDQDNDHQTNQTEHSSNDPDEHCATVDPPAPPAESPKSDEANTPKSSSEQTHIK